MIWLRKIDPFLTLGLLILGTGCLTGMADPPQAALNLSPEGVEFFEMKIRPVLVERCYLCHSAGSQPIQADLLLDSREGILKGGRSGPALIPGDPDHSLLIKALSHTEKETKMPPGEKLPVQQIFDFKAWIKMGAPDPRQSPTPVTPLVKKPQIDFSAGRQFWSFQLPRDFAPPKIKNTHWPRNAIDRFILAKLEERGLSPALPADRRTLIRRASFDLIGLPPRPEEVEAFLADQSPDAFAKIIDRLLASPHYGERWGRYWLDVVRYADSAGDSADYPVPQVYLYRNYVINSFNQDKSYARFLREQIAGDLLPSKSEPERWEHIVATGYLALSRRFSVKPEKVMHLTIEDTIDNIGKSILGLTISCARCHDHKYDPIPTEDYYALYGIFHSTRYPFAGSENDQGQKDFVYRLPQSEVEALLKPYEEQLAPLNAELKRLENELEALDELGPAAQENQPAQGKRTREQLKTEIKEIKKRRSAIAAQMPVLEKSFAVAEGMPQNGRVHRRGDPENLGDEVPRRFLQVLGGQELTANPAGSGRLQLTEWLTDPNNPLTARVMLNRIWQHHFGKGLVGTPSDFGKRGKPPSHPELLDYLTIRFIERGWSMKAMHRLIMLSQTYQLASTDRPENDRADPDNVLLWKFNRRRLDAESIRDAMLWVSGELDVSMGGPHPFPHESAWNFTQHDPFTAVYETNRRSVYLMVQRFQRHPYLSIFDGPDPNSSTAERLISTTPIQALFMMNSPFVHDQSDKLAARLIQSPLETHMLIHQAFGLAFSRPPTQEETLNGEAYLREALAKMQATNIPPDQHAQKAWASYLRVLLSSNEFVFVD